MFEKEIVKENRRISGGRKGRQEGYNYEDIVKDLFEKNLKVVSTIWKLKYGEDKSNFEIKKRGDKRAADIVILRGSKHVGLDTKQPASKRAQWMRKRIHLFLEGANEITKQVLLKYLAYGSKHKRIYSSYTEEEKKVIFKYLDDNKVKMIKRRWDSRPNTWCDFLLTTSKEKELIIKIVFVDDLLDKEFKIDKMKFCKTNYNLGEFISFKPYGNKQPDIQVMIDKKVFDSKYAIHINLKGKIIKSRKLT